MIITKESKVCVLTHVLTTVPAEDLKEYLINKKISLLGFVGHPLLFKEGRPGSFFKIYKKGKEVLNVQQKNKKYPLLYSYLKDIILSLFWIMRLGKKWDVIVALDNLNALSAIVLRRLGYAKKIIYYTIDYTPNRFQNKFLNAIYHWIDEFCVQSSDLIWNVSPRIIEGRKSTSKKLLAKQIIVPIGVWPQKISKTKLYKKESALLVYAGGLSKHQGIDLVIRSLKGVIKKVPEVKLYIIGLGDYEKYLKRLVKRLKLNNHVYFLGYFEKHDDVMNILSRGTLGMAMYSKKNSLWSYYADPSKIKSYLACGLPVFTTDLTYIANDIRKYQCGVISKYSSNSLSASLLSVLQNKPLINKYRQNALLYSQRFDWEKIFDNGFIRLN